MEVEALSDHDLREMLKDHGVNAGPVTNTTRTVLQKKLSKVISSSSQKEQHVIESYSEEKFESHQHVNGNRSVEEVVTSSVATELDGSLEDLTQHFTSNAHTLPTYTKTVSSEEFTHTFIPDGHAIPPYTTDVNAEIPESSHISLTAISSSKDQSEVSQHDDYEEILSERNYQQNLSRTPLRYAPNSYPSAENLRRRPLTSPRVAPVERISSKLNTEKTRSERISKVGAVNKAVAKKPSKWRWLCNRLLLFVVLVVLLLVLLVYYHMDDQRDFKPLPSAGKE